MKKIGWSKSVEQCEYKWNKTGFLNVIFVELKCEILQYISSRTQLCDRLSATCMLAS